MGEVPPLLLFWDVEFEFGGGVVCVCVCVCGREVEEGGGVEISA